MTTPELSRALHIAAELMPATPVIPFSRILALDTLGTGTHRRQCALDLSYCLVNLAAVLAGANRKTGL